MCTNLRFCSSSEISPLLSFHIILSFVSGARSKFKLGCAWSSTLYLDSISTPCWLHYYRRNRNSCKHKLFFMQRFLTCHITGSIPQGCRVVKSDCVVCTYVTRNICSFFDSPYVVAVIEIPRLVTSAPNCFSKVSFSRVTYLGIS